MPRCGQMSRSAKMRPASSRPKTSGSPSITLATRRFDLTARLGSARYQKSRSQIVIAACVGSRLLRGLFGARRIGGRNRLDARRAVLELGDLADRIELRVRQ